METSLNETLLSGSDVHPPLVSTPGDVHGVNENDMEISPIQPARDVSTPQSHAHEEQQPPKEVDAGGFVDMTVEAPVEFNCEFQTSLCKCIAKLIGSSPKLVELDTVRVLIKRKHSATPIEAAKHKALVCHFRKVICKHKASIELLLLDHLPHSVEYLKLNKSLKTCLQLICNLH